MFDAIASDEVRQYERRRRVALGESLRRKIAVYLDTKYWILLRGAASGRRPDAATTRLLALLRNLVHTGQAYCPLSVPIFEELLRQTDVATRLPMADLIDELSTGTMLTPQHERVGTELAHLFAAQVDPNRLDPVDWLVWSKPGPTLLDALPVYRDLDDETNAMLQISWLEHLWTLPLGKMLRMNATSLPPRTDRAALIGAMNQGIAENAAEIASPKQVLEDEVGGTVDVYLPLALEILVDRWIRSGGKGQPTDPAMEDIRAEMRNVLANVLMSDESSRKLPTMFIVSRLHAALRWDKQRRFETNDLPDFAHATGALAYCDVFLTEAGLHRLVTAGPYRLDKRFDCIVIAAPDEAVAYLEGLVSREDISVRGARQ
jgi:hypothetical protein